MAKNNSRTPSSLVLFPKCRKCGTEKKKAKGGQWYCGKCALDRTTLRYHRLKESDPEAFKKLRDKNYAAAVKWRSRPENVEKVKRYAKTNRYRSRMTCLLAYSGPTLSCVCCGENNVEFLTIDHIDGGGNLHRKQINANGNNFYKWLIKEGFPAGYRVLCMNCNWSIGLHGYCPHARKEQVSKD